MKRKVLDGEFETLPKVFRAPTGAIAVNHSVQACFIETEDGKHNVIRMITFESEGKQGKVKGALAATHAHGELHFINYGTKSNEELLLNFNENMF